MARRTLLVVLAAALAVAAAVPAAAQDAPAPAGRNLLLTVKVGKVADGARQDLKEYRLVLAERSAGSRLLSGARVPLATEVGGEGAVASFTYQNIGFSVSAEARPMPDGRVALQALLEDSRVGEGGDGGGPPTVETRQLSVNAVLADGEPLEITRVQDLGADAGFVEIRVDVLD